LQSVHVISHLVRELRELGKDRDLLDEVWRRLGDMALLERPDLQESIQQMHRREGHVLRRRRDPRLRSEAPQDSPVPIGTRP